MWIHSGLENEPAWPAGDAEGEFRSVEFTGTRVLPRAMVAGNAVARCDIERDVCGISALDYHVGVRKGGPEDHLGLTHKLDGLTI